MPLGAVYIDANFKETQLDQAEARTKAELSVDALLTGSSKAPW